LADYKNTVEKILKSVDVEINGSRPWDLQVHDERFYARVLSGGSLALGETYMDGLWDCKALDQLSEKLLSGRIDKQVKASSPSFFLVLFRAYLFNPQSKKRAYMVGEKHYDVGNDLFSLMLDERMNYSCGYWRNAENLDQAQINKLDLICRKMHLRSGMNVLEIGCGWGGFAKYAAENYGVSVNGVTISEQQVVFAQDSCKGLNDSIELKDYRELNGQYDRVVSVGLFEHVGYQNYKKNMEVVHRCLKENGLFLLHTIGRNHSRSVTDPWINKYIFPNGMTPSVQQIGTALEGLFVVEDWHNFGQDYDATLMSWNKNFQNNFDKLKDLYDDRFKRMWEYYLLMCAGTFRSRRNQLWQLVMSKPGIKGGYTYKNNPRFD